MIIESMQGQPRSLTLLLVVLFLTRMTVANLDRFNYDQTDGTDYGPADWRRVDCNNLKVCQGWPDAWEMAIEWELDENHCVWCPAENDGRCGNHHQSPINLERNRAVEGHEMENECIDIHWMAYHDSTCDFDTLKEKNAFTVERHALKIVQPLKRIGQDEYDLDCRNSRWGQIDFSKGFSQWWHLSHVDFHVPSEHTQEGKRYAGEIQMYHWYSVNATVAGIHNEMAAVSFFLESYDDTQDYDVLNRIICQWRKAEDRTREQCNLPSVESEYPGCFYNRRGHALFNTTLPDIETQSLGGRRELRGGAQPTTMQEKPLSAHDIIMHNWKHQHGATDQPMKTIRMSPDIFSNPDPDFDWDAFIASQYAQDEELVNDEHHRKLIDYNHVRPWFNYFPLLAVRTEYYYRYSGTQTVPPCYGRWFAGNERRQTNHWRVMKDPIRVSQRQIDEMHRLLKERIAPKSDPINPCQPDTAAKQDPNDPSKVSVARPLQSTRPNHFKVFCECADWGSKWEEDRAWCRQNKNERLYNRPYNFEHEGF